MMTPADIGQHVPVDLDTRRRLVIADWSTIPCPTKGELFKKVGPLADLNFLSKVEHEASFCLPSLYFCKRLVHLFKFGVLP